MARLGRWAAIAALSGATVGCATVASEAPRHADAPCLPPIVTREFFGWPVVAVAAVAGRMETGQVVPVAVVRYQQEGDAVLVHWALGRLLVVDPSPDTDAAPWIDVGALRADGSRIRASMRACHWSRPGLAV